MKNLILIFLFAMIAICCERSDSENAYDPQLPPLTTAGANTFGAIINGKVMVPRNSTGYIPPGSTHYAVSYSSSNNYESIATADMGGTKRGGIFIYVKNALQQFPLSEGAYIIQNSNGAFENYFADGIMITCSFNINNQITTYLSIADTGKITITKNAHNIFAGTFSCKLRNKDNLNDIIEITDGRFDFNKATINTTNFP